MNIVIIGIGAMGSVYGGLFAAAGHNVIGIDPWQDHINAINQNGLRVSGASGDRTVTTIKAQSPDDPLPDADLYIIATKAAHVRAAGEKIIKEGGEAPVLTIQNGFGSGEILAETIPQDRILLGVAEGFGASIKTPGHAHHSSMTRIRLGLYGGGSSPVLDQITRLWVEAGFPAEQYGDIDQLIWEKYVCNVTLSGACTITGLTVAELRRDPALWQIAVNCGLEAYAVGKARGVHFSYDDPIAYVTAFADKLGDARPSMSLDHLAKRKSEIDVLNGMVPVMAKALNIPTPVNEVVSALVRHLETKF
ncbi:MAG: 2-dehydropantoate 2-reductase [Alphaproteobacteria bacterium]|nr:2-dehydropantoate 2-reductase [Alphaproteobacteria bacterium]